MPHTNTSNAPDNEIVEPGAAPTISCPPCGYEPTIAPAETGETEAEIVDTNSDPMHTSGDQRVVNDRARQSVHFSSATCEWSTPQPLFERFDAQYHFDLDPCCTHENAKCETHFTEADDGLAQSWEAHRVWMNPPYGNPTPACRSNCRKKSCVRRGHHVENYIPGIGDWMRKAWEESQRGALVVCLVPVRTDTRWWHQFAVNGKIEYLRGRLKFGDAKNCAPFPSAIVVFEPRQEAPAPISTGVGTTETHSGDHERAAQTCPPSVDTNAVTESSNRSATMQDDQPITTPHDPNFESPCIPRSFSREDYPHHNDVRQLSGAEDRRQDTSDALPDADGIVVDGNAHSENGNANASDRSVISGNESVNASDGNVNCAASTSVDPQEKGSIEGDDKRVKGEESEEKGNEKAASPSFLQTGSVTNTTRDSVTLPAPPAPSRPPLPPGFGDRVYGVRLGQARELGITAAVILHYFGNKLQFGNLREVDGVRWITKTADELSTNAFPWLSPSAINAALRHLEAAGTIRSRRLGRRGTDRKKSYTLATETIHGPACETVYFEAGDAVAYGVHEALLLENLRLRFQRAADENYPQVSVDMRPKDLARRLPISARTIERALGNLVRNEVLERIPDHENQCSRYRLRSGLMPGQAECDPFTHCADCTLIPESERATRVPVAGLVATVNRLFVPEFYAIPLDSVIALGEFAFGEFSGTEGGVLFANAMRIAITNVGCDTLFDIALSHSYPDELERAIRTQIWDAGKADGWLSYVLLVWLATCLRFPGLRSQFERAIYKCLDNRTPTETFYQVVDKLFLNYAEARAATRVKEFKDAHRSRTEHLERRDDLPAHEKVHVFYNAINVRLSCGAWNGHWGWSPYPAIEDSESCRLIYDFFRRNPAADVASLIYIHGKCSEFSPEQTEDSEEQEGGSSGDSASRKRRPNNCVPSRGHNIGYLVNNLDRLVRRLGVSGESFESRIAIAPNGRRFVFPE